MIKKLKKELIKLSESEYKAFSEKLNPNTSNILGIRLPILRKIAKKILKENYQLFFQENDDEFFELTMLEGMVIGYLNPNEQANYIKQFIPKINNWAICDSFCSGLKNFKKDYSLNFLEKYINSDKEFEIRFGYVILLNYYIETNYTYVMEKISKFNNEAYYAKMAVAWCLSYCLIKKYKECFNDIQNLTIHPWVKNKGITKAIESLKLDKKQKEELKILRKSK